MVANTELQRVELSGWRTGLANLLRKENRAWWASRRWLVQSVLWTVVVNGLVAAIVLIPGEQLLCQAGMFTSRQTGPLRLTFRACAAHAKGAPPRWFHATGRSHPAPIRAAPSE